MTKRNVDYLKPPKLRNYLTLSEVCAKLGKDPTWIRQLEREGRIPKAQRVARGKVKVRLWSPAQVDEIEQIIAGHRPGRPSNG